MNKIYKVVWNKARNMYVVVSEMAKNSTKGCSAKKLLTMLIATGVMSAGVLMGGSPAYAANTITGDRSLAVGNENTINGDDSIAVGTGVTVVGAKSMAVGNGASVAASEDNLLVSQKKALEKEKDEVKKAELLEKYLKTNATNSIAMGTNAKVMNHDAVATGADSKATEAFASAYGAQAVAGNRYATAIGSRANALGNGSVAIGSTALSGDFTVEDASSGGGQEIRPDNLARMSVHGGTKHTTTASGADAVALGSRALATEQSTVAIGSKAQATGEYANSIGQNAVAAFAHDNAMGTAASATGGSSNAIGMKAAASGYASNAIGNNAVASSDESQAMGSSAKASNYAAIAMGFNAKASGRDALALSTSSIASGRAAIAVGQGAKASGNYATAEGWNAQATGNRSFAAGAQAKSYGYMTTAVGAGAQAGTEAFNPSKHLSADDLKTYNNLQAQLKEKQKAVTDTKNAWLKANNDYDVAKWELDTGNYKGTQADAEKKLTDAAAATKAASTAYNKAVQDEKTFSTVTYEQQMGQLIYNYEKQTYGAAAFGVNAKATGYAATAIGVSSVASNTYALANGYKAQATAGGSAAVGTNAKAIASYAQAFGYDAEAGAEVYDEEGKLLGVSGTSALAVGHTAKAKANYSQAVGFGAEASAFASQAYGYGAKATATVAQAYGYEAKATDIAALAVGYQAQSSADSALAFGYDSNASVAQGVALGAHSKANTAYGEMGYDLSTADHVHVHADDATAVEKSVWQSTMGAVSVGDAENGGTRQITGVAAGTQDTDAVNVAQLKQVQGVVEDAVNHSQKHTIVTVEEGEVAPDEETYSTDKKNLQIRADEKDGQTTYDIKLNKHVNLTADGSLTVGNTLVNNSGISIFDPVAPGKIDSSLTATVLRVYGHNYIQADLNTKTETKTVRFTLPRVDNTGKITDMTDGVDRGYTMYVDMGNNIVHGVGDAERAQDAVNLRTLKTYISEALNGGQAVDNNHRPLSPDTSANDDVTGNGSSKNIGGNSAGTGANSGSGHPVSPNTGSAESSGNVTPNANGAGGASSGAAADGMNLHGTVNYFGDNDTSSNNHANHSLKMVGAATGIGLDPNVIVEVQPVSTENVHNPGTIATIRLAEKVNLGDNGSFTTGDTVINNEGVKVGGTTLKHNELKMGDVTVNDNGLTINEGPSVTKQGISGGDKKITNVARGEADTDAVNVSQLKEVQQGVENNANSINNLNNRMNKGLAGAAALAALHPLDFDPDDKLSFAAGVGNYKGENAAAVGMFYRPDEKVMFNVGGTVGNGENMVNAGISFSLDRTPRRTNTKTAMAKEILELRERVDQLTSLVERLTGANTGRTGDIVFPDVPENHWAYDYVYDLVKKGVIEGYPNGTFGGDRSMTRYEFSTMLWRAMQAGMQVPSELTSEFKNELDELGRFRVDRIHGEDGDKRKVERIRVNGDKKDEAGQIVERRDHYGSIIPNVAEAE